MAYNYPQFYPPQPYQPPYQPAAQQMLPQPPAAPPAPQNQGPSMAWVNSEQEARDFIVMPGNTVMLMSKNEEVFWLKATDQTGMPMPLRTFDYRERAAERAQGPQPQKAEYVTRSEFEALEARLDAMTAPRGVVANEQPV